MTHPYAGMVRHWLEKIALAIEWKHSEFGKDAAEAMRFFDGPYNFLYGPSASGSGDFVFAGRDENFPRPTFGVTINKVAEMVQIFGPALYHRNPDRMVNPRMIPQVPAELFMPPPGMGGAEDQMQMQMMAMQHQVLAGQVNQQRYRDMARSALLEHYLDYTPEALDLKTESRWAIDEAIIKGMGLLMQEVYVPPTGAAPRLAGSFFESVDNLVIDPDANLLRDAKWVAFRCIHPVWQVEREYGLPPGTLRPQLESLGQQAGVSAYDMDYRRRQGRTSDLLVYWKIYSKLGMGGRLAGVDPRLRELSEPFGDYVYLVVAEGNDGPINLSQQVLASGDMTQILEKTQWPTPFWADDGWPFVPIIFHDRPNKLWPMSHLKPGMGELKFINWVYSFITSKIKNACRDFVAFRKSAGEEIRSAILNGNDYALLELEEQHGTIREVVEFLQHPQFHGDIWTVLQAVEANFEKRVGLTELMYGMSSRQYRSAEEAATKRDAIMVRPDDMATKVEEAMTLAARREALVVRWHLEGRDVMPVMGPVGAQLWDDLITSANPGDILYGLEYRIEAGSVRKPNQEGRIAQMTQAMQTMFQPLWTFAMQTGNVQPVNALLADWGKANDLNVEKYLIPPPPVPQMAGPEAGNGGEESAPAEAPPE